MGVTRRVAAAYARISPRLAHRPGSAAATKAHAWLLRRTNGRVGGRLLGAPVLVLRTTGRKSGRPRESPTFYLEYGDGFAVVASNAASKRPPAWYLNLKANSEVEVLARGSARAMRAREATPEEREALWPRLVELYVGYDLYRSLAERDLPVVVLEPRRAAPPP